MTDFNRFFRHHILHRLASTATGGQYGFGFGTSLAHQRRNRVREENPAGHQHRANGLGMPLKKWMVKSTSKAVEGLYVYDTVQRLNDSRFGDRDVSDIRHYIRYGALGQAFLSDERTVLLIDEIDKADLEFPNDLLSELDEMAFTVLETDERITAKIRPVVHHHLQQREGASRPLPSPLRFSLHRLPRRSPDGAYRGRAFPKALPNVGFSMPAKILLVTLAGRPAQKTEHLGTHRLGRRAVEGGRVRRGHCAKDSPSWGC